MGAPVNANKYCLQKFDVLDMIEYGCSYSQCRHCGHNENVARYRKQLIRKYGLTKRDSDGLRRFIVPKRRRGNVSKDA